MSEQSNPSDKRIVWAKRIAATLGVLIFVIFAITTTLGYVYCTTDRPAKEVLLGTDAGMMEAK